MKLESFKSHGVIKSIINYKNTDYTPTFFKKKLVGKEEHLKTITITCIFHVNNMLTENIEIIRSKLINTTIEHNGFEYDLFFESMSDLEITNNSLATVVYTCKGSIYYPEESKEIINSGYFKIKSNKDVPVNIRITNASGELRINNMIFRNLKPTEIVVVDSVKGKVTGISGDKWLFWEFPKTELGNFYFNKTGQGTVTLSARGEV